MPRSGIASGQRVLRSIIVRRYVKPEEKGKGPKISMFMCENLFSGTEKCSSGASDSGSKALYFISAFCSCQLKKAKGCLPMTLVELYKDGANGHI